jgi:hypothetical protein
MESIPPTSKVAVLMPSLLKKIRREYLAKPGRDQVKSLRVTMARGTQKYAKPDHPQQRPDKPLRHAAQ